VQRAKTKSLPSFEALPSGDRQTKYARLMWREFYRAARIATDELDPVPCRVATLALAHTGVETAYGAYLYGWNVGNIMAQGTEHFYASQDTTAEPLPGGGTGNKVFAARFVWYPTAFAGVAGYLKVVRDRERYAKAWAAMMAGDPYFLIELRHGGYFEGRSYVHAGETLPRVDTDEEILAVFVQHVQRVNADTCDLRPTKGRAVLGMAIAGSFAASSVATTLANMLED